MSKKKIYRSEIQFDICVLASNLKEARELTKKYAIKEIDQCGIFRIACLKAVDGKNTKIPKEWNDGVPWDDNDFISETCEQILKAK